MPVAEIDLYNLALSHIGNSKEVQSVNENSAEARACKRFYAQTRDEILREFPWPFAKVTVALALVETDPTTEWKYAYRYPVDCVFFRRILGDCRIEVRDTRVPYLIGQDAEGKLVYTDRQSAVAEYTVAVSDTSTFDPLFAQALAFKLGFYIAPRVTASDPFKLGQRAFTLYQMAVEQARDMALNEQQDDPEPDSEFILYRG